MFFGNNTLRDVLKKLDKTHVWGVIWGNNGWEIVEGTAHIGASVQIDGGMGAEHVGNDFPAYETEAEAKAELIYRLEKEKKELDEKIKIIKENNV